MSLFFLTIFIVYGGMHAYAFSRARSAVAFGPVTGTALGAFMVIMTLAPFFIRLLERNDFEISARALSYIAYLWMAALFLFFCCSIFLDLASLVVRIASWVTNPELARLLIPAKTVFFISTSLSLAICVYGYFEALNIRTERLRIETTKLPAGTDRLTIVQISDVHLGLIVRCDRLAGILDVVKAAKPDIFVSTGDLVDAQINHLSGLRELLQEIKPRYGKFAITGNHEYYAGLKQATAFTEEAGFTLLRGKVVNTGVINIAGVDDPTGEQMHIDKPESESALLSGLPKDQFTLLLKHRPVANPNGPRLFDLQLSGHTHKGQIFPFTYISAIAYPLNAGRFDLSNGAILYVSRGTGTWGPPIRFLSPPEVTVIELVRKPH
ncbi:MAG TPA: metallophosphoesterase [Nitrospirota bacterium]|nr:metallophosphoesterase [Nitrospirota bacterium]